MSARDKDEVICLTCDGSGTQPDKGAPHGVSLCSGCNGHGVVVYVKDVNKGSRVAKYAVGTDVAFCRWIN